MFCIALFYFTDSACQNINTQDHCYVSDPSCPTQTFNEQINSSSSSTVIYTPTGFTEEIKSSSLSGFVPLHQTLFEDTSNADIVFAVCALIYVAILLMFVVWYRKRRKLRKKDRLITGKIDNNLIIIFVQGIKILIYMYINTYHVYLFCSLAHRVTCQFFVCT